MTAIEAVWHPLVDIVVCGRYPDPNFPGYEEGELRSVDMFNVDTGTCDHKLEGMGGIISLNQFNSAGDTLASAMGRNLLIWRSKDVTEHGKVDEEQMDCVKALKKNARKGNSKKKNLDDENLKVKVKCKVPQKKR